ncbi:MAG: aminoacyl-tRNA hydrolase, partial [Actinomycetota bacterium]
GESWLVVGLGNPGRRYARTRHNAGARAVERLSAELRARKLRTRAPALVAVGRLGDARVLIARPATYMNESGDAVRPLMRLYETDVDNLIVVYDEIDLRAGMLRIRIGGGTAGHNGLTSVVQAIGDPGFYRVRIGVGRPPGNRDPAEWVLEKMPPAEAEQLEITEAAAGEAVRSIIVEGLERAMNRFNQR